MLVRSILRTGRVLLTRRNTIKCYTTSAESRERKPITIDRSGDDGTSKTLSGQRLPKDNPIFNALGSTEELISFLGLAREHALEAEHLQIVDNLRRTQSILIELNLSISRFSDTKKKSVSTANIKEVEEWIEEVSKGLLPPEEILMPGGGMSSTSLLYARALCMRVEREVVPLVRAGLATEAQIYLNRLAQYLKLASRAAAKAELRSENIYVPVPEDSGSPAQKKQISAKGA